VILISLSSASVCCTTSVHVFIWFPSSVHCNKLWNFVGRCHMPKV
jgi:hypothetical protein